MIRLLPFAVIFLAAAAMAQAPAPALAQQVSDEQDMRDLYDGLRNGTLPPAFVSEECRKYLADSEEDEGLDEFLAGYLEVPVELGEAAFCASLVQAIKDGAVPLETLAVIARERHDAAMYREVGRLLRAVYFTHRSTTTASAERVVPR
jgi:hypothetical protein